MVWSVISVLNRYKLFHVWPRFRSRCRIRSRSELLSWPNPEEPQEWVKRRRFWRKPRQSTSLKSGVEELELLSLVLLLQQEVEEAPSPASGFPPGKNNRCKYTKKLKWERVAGVGGAEKSGGLESYWGPDEILLQRIRSLRTRSSEGKPSHRVSVRQEVTVVSLCRTWSHVFQLFTHTHMFI